jgi:hypothetical protein
MATTLNKKIDVNAWFGKLVSFPMAPRRQFHRLVVLGIATLLIVTAAHLYLFYRIQSYNFLSGTAVDDAPAPKVNQGKLKNVLDRYAQKANTRVDVGVLVSPVADPAK